MYVSAFILSVNMYLFSHTFWIKIFCSFSSPYVNSSLKKPFVTPNQLKYPISFSSAHHIVSYFIIFPFTLSRVFRFRFLLIFQALLKNRRQIDDAQLSSGSASTFAYSSFLGPQLEEPFGLGAAHEGLRASTSTPWRPYREHFI